MPIVATLLFGLAMQSSFGSPTVTPFAGGKKAAFSLEFDDSMDSQVKNALPLLAQYRFPATFYINPGRHNYRAEVWEKAVLAAGHELGDHTMHHRDTVGAEQGAKEIGDAAKVIERAYGRPRLTTFGTPGGVKWEIPPDDFRRILRENRLFFPGREDFYQDGQGDILRFPKLALEKGSWRKLGFHGVGGEWLSTSVDNLSTLLRFLDAHRDEFWVAPTGTVWKYQREREALQSIGLSSDGDQAVTLTPRFDRSKLQSFELYDVPLTLSISVPPEWKRAQIIIGGRKRTVKLSNSTLRFDFLPRSGPIIVNRSGG